jgi:hypothetical protein
MRLQQDLLDWAEWYDSTLNLSDPINCGFPNDSERDEFKRTGFALGERLKAELGDGYIVEIKIFAGTRADVS